MNLNGNIITTWWLTMPLPSKITISINADADVGIPNAAYRLLQNSHARTQATFINKTPHYCELMLEFTNPDKQSVPIDYSWTLSA